MACESDGGDPPAARWHLVLDELSGALFSVAGTAQDDVWVVGADRGEGRGPTLLHWDGQAWTRPDTGLEGGHLLWAHAFEPGLAFFAGSGGAILRYRDGALEPMDTPTEQLVWGIWGSAADDLWAVGGQPEGGTGFVWRFEGEGWRAVELAEDLPSPSAWFKVWGTAGDDVWFCGMDGAMLHWDGAALEAVDSATTRSLLTVHGRADGSLVTAVGGAFSATLVASEQGGPFRDVTPPGDPPLQTFGVHHRGRTAYAVGMQALVLRHDGTAWQDVDHGLDVYGDLHGVWIDPSGGVWAAGGLVVSPPYLLGTLIYRGQSPPGPLLQ